MRGRPHGDKIKARALAELSLGRRVGELSRELAVPQQTISEWAKEVGGLDTIRYDRIGELVFSFLNESLLTLEAQNEMFRDEEWLKRQDADKLAKLYEAISDQTIRVLAAMERGHDQAQERQLAP